MEVGPAARIGTREISVTLNTDFAASEKIENIKAILIVLLSVLAAVIHQSDCSRSPFSKKSPPTPLWKRGVGGDFLPSVNLTILGRHYSACASNVLPFGAESLFTIA